MESASTSLRPAKTSFERKAVSDAPTLTSLLRAHSLLEGQRSLVAGICRGSDARGEKTGCSVVSADAHSRPRGGGCLATRRKLGRRVRSPDFTPCGERAIGSGRTQGRTPNVFAAGGVDLCVVVTVTRGRCESWPWRGCVRVSGTGPSSRAFDRKASGACDPAVILGPKPERARHRRFCPQCPPADRFWRRGEVRRMSFASSPPSLSNSFASRAADRRRSQPYAGQTVRIRRKVAGKRTRQRDDIPTLQSPKNPTSAHCQCPVCMKTPAGRSPTAYGASVAIT